MYHVDHPYPSPPPFLPVCYVERAKYGYWVLRNNSSVQSVAVTRSCDTLVLTASSLSSLATSSPFFILPWEKVSWPFFGLSLCLFSIRSLGLSCFPILHWASLVASHEVQPPAWPSSELSESALMKGPPTKWPSDTLTRTKHPPK
jgi:hypothetical protein